MQKGIIRIGKVSSVDKIKITARVIFNDLNNLVSAPLPILGTPNKWLPEIGTFVVCVYLPNGESDGFIIGVI